MRRRTPTFVAAVAGALAVVCLASCGVFPAIVEHEFGTTTVPEEPARGLEEYSPQEGWQAEISAENVGLLDADVIVFATESQDMFDELQDFGTLDSLEAVQEDRSVYTDEILAGAIYFDTPLAHQYLLDNLTPKLAKAAAGESPRSFPS